MTTNVRLLVPYAPAATLRALARDVHRRAVSRYLETSNAVQFHAELRHVEAIEDRARLAAEWEARMAEAMAERDAIHSGAELILAMAGRRGRKS